MIGFKAERIAYGFEFCGIKAGSMKELVRQLSQKINQDTGVKISIEVGKCGESFTTDAPTQVFALILREGRKKSGFSLREVAKRAGLKSHSQIYKYENGEKAPTPEVLARLVMATGACLEIKICKVNEKN